MLTYQVGHLTNIDPADPELADQRKAIALAIAESDRDQASAFRVWTGQEHGSVLIGIAYQSELFRK